MLPKEPPSVELTWRLTPPSGVKKAVASLPGARAPKVIEDGSGRP